MGEDSAGTFEKLAESGGIVLAGVVFQLGLGFIARILVARLLGKVDYGAVALGYTLLTFASVVVVVGTDTGIGRYLPRFDDPGRRRGVLYSAYQVALPISIALGVGIAALAEPLATVAFGKPEIAPVLRVFALAIPLAAFVRLTVGCARGMKQSPPRVYIQNLALPLARFALIAVVLLLGFRAVGIAWAYAGAYGVAATLSVVYLVKRTPLFADAAPVPIRGELLAFSIPLMLTATMHNLFHNVDTFLLGALVSTGEVGVYDAVYRVGQLLTVVLTSFGFMFMPIISEAHSNDTHDEMRRLYQVVSKWIVFVSLPIFLVIAFFPEVVIRFTFGPEYRSGALTLSVLAVGFFITASAGPNGNALTAIGKPRAIMYDNVAVVVVNVVLNLLLIPRYSILGAAIATTVGYVLMDGLYLAQLYRATGIHPFRRETIVPAATALCLWAALTLALRPIVASPAIRLLVAVGTYLVVYPIIIVRLGGVEPEDIGLIEAFEDRIGVDIGPVRRVARQFAN
jgi:O-antigen/teichoic acid export membrane protein